MAAASYSTDLQTINLVNVAGGTTGWTALGGGPSGLVAETDFYIQGDGCISKAAWSTNIRGMIYNNGAGVTIDSGSAVFMWLYFWAPNALDTEAGGGLRVIMGSSTADYRHWYVRGSDTLIYGGWNCIPVDPLFSPDETTGTPTTTIQYFGSLADVLGSISKGQPIGIDAFRHGRSLIIINGDVTGYGTFLSASIVNDSINNRYGLFQAIAGGYLMQGRVLMGSGSTSVDFRDANRNITIADTKKVNPSFNAFEIQNSNSNVEWTAINVSSLGDNAPGDFIMTDNATVSLTNCTFARMGYFYFDTSASIDTCTFRTNNTIFQSGALFDNCTFENSRDTTRYLVSDNPENITNCSFTFVQGTGHAIEITQPGEYIFSGNTFSGYGATGTITASIYNNSGGPVTMSIAGGGDTPTYRNGTGAGTLILNTVVITLTGLKDNTEIRVYETGSLTEVAGIENATDGTVDNRTFAFSISPSLTVDIVVHNISYEYEIIENFFIPSQDTSLPIQQRLDRNYNNPPGP